MSFKMGFNPLADKRLFVPDERYKAFGITNVKLNLSKRVYWSRDVTVEVSPPHAR
jgi:hypothetical protein